AVRAVALALGAIARLVGLARAPPSGEPTPEASAARRRGRAAVAAFATWMLLGTLQFSQVERLHTRYLEAFTAAIAATLGIALASLATAAPRSRLAAGALAIGVAVASTLSLRLSGTSGSIATVATVAAAAVAIGCAVLTLPGLERLRRPGAAGVLIALALVAVLLGPADYARGLVQAGSSDSGRPGSMPPRRLDKIANYLATHSAGTRYELASASAVTAGPLIVRDGRPVLVLTSLNGLPFASQQQVQTAVETGQVRYAMLPRGHCTPRFAGKARCAPGVLWARAHGTDVSPAAGLRRGTLYSLSPQPVPAR
ncbi:MAG: hypothetical protein QOJ07_1345, partial [Thermoleophilaceae bacterium]|nr:hypothetical protein [Thermoleophilaceae bacterium]